MRFEVQGLGFTVGVRKQAEESAPQHLGKGFGFRELWIFGESLGAFGYRKINIV